MTDMQTTRLLQDLARGLDQILNGNEDPQPHGFVILVFPFAGELGQRTNYVSNCKREDIVVALKEVVARFEGQPEVRGTA